MKTTYPTNPAANFYEWQKETGASSKHEPSRFKVFPFNGYQFKKDPIYDWNPMRIVDYRYTKRKVDSSEEVIISAQEFEANEVWANR